MGNPTPATTPEETAAKSAHSTVDEQLLDSGGEPTGNLLCCLRLDGQYAARGTMETAARLRLGETLGDRVLKVNHAGENGAATTVAAEAVVLRHLAAQLRDLGEDDPDASRTEAVIWLGMHL